MAILVFWSKMQFFPEPLNERHVPKSSINILSFICFARNGLLISSHISYPISHLLSHLTSLISSHISYLISHLLYHLTSLISSHISYIISHLLSHLTSLISSHISYIISSRISYLISHLLSYLTSLISSHISHLRFLLQYLISLRNPLSQYKFMNISIYQWFELINFTILICLSVSSWNGLKPI